VPTGTEVTVYPPVWMVVIDCAAQPASDAVTTRAARIRMQGFYVAAQARPSRSLTAAHSGASGGDSMRIASQPLASSARKVA